MLGSEFFKLIQLKNLQLKKAKQFRGEKIKRDVTIGNFSIDEFCP